MGFRYDKMYKGKVSALGNNQIVREHNVMSMPALGKLPSPVSTCLRLLVVSTEQCGRTLSCNSMARCVPCSVDFLIQTEQLCAFRQTSGCSRSTALCSRQISGCIPGFTHDFDDSFMCIPQVFWRASLNRDTCCNQQRQQRINPFNKAGV